MADEGPRTASWRALPSPAPLTDDVVNGRRAVTASTALRLARFFGNSPEFWMNAQLACDLYEAECTERSVLEKIGRLQ